MKKIVYLLLLSGAICFFIFLIHLIITKTAIYGDGRYYYSIVRSFIIDGDLDYSNEYSYFGINEFKTSTGYLANKYSLGTSLIWTPTFFITHMLIKADGFSFPYQIVTGLTTIIFSMIGLYFLYQMLGNFYSKKVSLFTVLVTLFGTNLFYYSSFDVINSHGISFAFTSLYFYLLFKPQQFKNWFLLGLLIGLITLIRTQDAILFVPGLIIIISQNRTLLTKLKSFFLFVLGLVITFSLQFYSWQTIYGTFYKSPYINKIEGFSFLNPRILGVLFNSDSGLVLWTPFVFFGIVGLFFIKNSYRNLLLVTFITEFYLVASWSSWNQGASFGIRMLISVLPLVAFGFGHLLNNFKDTKKMAIFLSFSSLINTSLILIFLLTH